MHPLRICAVVVVCVIGSFLVACECTPESDDELCGDRQCGSALVVDNCGDERTVDCGNCADGEHCRANQCVCQPESSDQLCQALDAECGLHDTEDQCGQQRTIYCGDCPGPAACYEGSCQCDGESEQALCDEYDLACGGATVLDRCSEIRSVDCGTCPAPDECIDNTCVCLPESEQQLCEHRGFNCGTTTVEDQCGDDRDISCGECTEPNECIDNVCDCIPESEEQLCEDEQMECGTATVDDTCLQSRSIDCGGCADYEECHDHQCECVGESDDELCDQLAGACGDVTTTDVCGVEREITCQPCATGESTFGAVRDGDTGELLDGAHLRIYDWPPPGGDDAGWIWDAGYRDGDPDYETTTSSNGGDFNYEFASDDPICIDDRSATLQPFQWYRVVVELDGYAPGIFYLRHDGYDSGACPDVCPADPSAGCNRQDFEIWPEDADYPQPPNLLADPRELRDQDWQCALLPDDADADRLIGFRVPLGGANVGQGPLHLEGTEDGGDAIVLQHVHRSDGSPDSREVESGTFEHWDDHGHIHFMNWFRMDLVERSDDCRDVDDRSSGCVVADGDKISFCLHDLEHFDRDVADHFGGMGAMFPDPPTCDSTEQGVTQGWIDTYSKRLPGQVIIVGEPNDIDDLGPLWIEAEIDPDRVLQEVDRRANVAQIPVELPDDGDSICDDSDAVLDCSMPPEDYDSSMQHRQCGDYLDWAD